jgi:nicotinamide mononucleotide transporter
VDSLLHPLQLLTSSALAAALAPAFTLWGTGVSWLEAVAFVLAIVMVVLNMRVNPIAWPLAIISSLLYFALFWDSRLYGDASLQIFFAVIALWGWWQWLRGTQADGEALEVRALPPNRRWQLFAALAVAWPATGWFLKHYTNTDVPWWDAFPTAASVIGQWLLGRKYVENWLAWIVVNIVSVGLFAYKGLWLTTLLYSLFIVMSFVGWRAWRSMLMNRRATTPSMTQSSPVRP